MFFDRLLAFDHLRHQIHIVAAADVSRESPRRAYDRAVRDIAAIERKLAAGLRPAMWRKSAKTKPGKLKIHCRNDASAVSAQRGALQGIHCRRRHFSGGAVAAARFHPRHRAVRSLPRPAPGESLAVPLFSADGRDANPRFFTRDAGPCDRTQAGIPSHRRYASARDATRPKICASSSRCATTKRNAPSTSCWSISAATISDE